MRRHLCSVTFISVMKRKHIVLLYTYETLDERQTHGVMAMMMTMVKVVV